MQKYFNNVQTKGGSAVAGARVTIRTAGGSLATIYSDNGVTVTSNPIYTNTFGYFEFYAADGRYSIEIAGAGIGTQTISDVLLEDPADEQAAIQAAQDAADAAQQTADGNAVALAASGGAALVGFIQLGDGAVNRSLQDKERESISVFDYGAVGDGVADDGPAIQKAINAQQTLGVRLRVPAGTYLIETAVVPTITADVDVDCDARAVFVASASLSNKVFFFNKTSGAKVSLRWRGGKIDGSGQPNENGTHTSAWDCFYVAEKFDFVLIDGLSIYNGADYSACGSDSGIFAVAENVRITNCRFQGVWDSAIYLSGDSAESNGNDALISGNAFIKCNVGVISKRKYQRYVASENFFDRCVTGISTGEADTTLLPGSNNIIVSNHIVQPKASGIALIISDGSVIANNRIEDQGYDLTDTLVAAGSNGIRLAGSANCVVEGNWIGMRRFATGASGHRGIQLERRTYNGSNYDCTSSLIKGNRIVGINVGIREDDANQSFGRFMFNMITGATTRITKAGTGSFYAEFTTDTAARVDMVGTLSLGGVFGAESLRVNPVAGAVDFLSVSGSTGGAPVLQAIGNSTNIDLRFLPKGTGVMRFGAFTSNVDAPITGYVTIKTDDGTTRKLAVIA